MVEPRAAPLTPEAEPSSSPILRSQDGGTSQAPAFLQAPRAESKPEAASEDGESRPRARRRRAPRTFEGPAEGEASAAPNADVSEEA